MCCGSRGKVVVSFHWNRFAHNFSKRTFHKRNFWWHSFSNTTFDDKHSLFRSSCLFLVMSKLSWDWTLIPSTSTPVCLKTLKWTKPFDLIHSRKLFCANAFTCSNNTSGMSEDRLNFGHIIKLANEEGPKEGGVEEGWWPRLFWSFQVVWTFCCCHHSQVQCHVSHLQDKVGTLIAEDNLFDDEEDQSNRNQTLLTGQVNSLTVQLDCFKLWTNDGMSWLSERLNAVNDVIKSTKSEKEELLKKVNEGMQQISNLKRVNEPLK